MAHCTALLLLGLAILGALLLVRAPHVGFPRREQDCIEVAASRDVVPADRCWDRRAETVYSVRGG